MIRLLVADDQPIVRAGLAGLIAGTEICIVCEVATCSEAVRQATRSKPDVVLLDIRMPETDGFQALKQIKQQSPQLPVLMYSISDSLTEITLAHREGASGYVPKGVGRDAFLLAIRKAALGKSAWTRQQLRRVRTHVESEGPFTNDTVCITPRERQVLLLLPKGMANEDIAEELGVDIETVKQHVKHILKKLGVDDRTQAAVWALRHGLV
jgi:DNA-binding NarL/FixJ family response regulator